ncbi:MAG TPA: hypothetical protein VEX68_01765 [Bryobacteraceae bacterium]|nr:hypothetical protein [Bryobacteraceae bacterium]
MKRRIRPSQPDKEITFLWREDHEHAELVEGEKGLEFSFKRKGQIEYCPEYAGFRPVQWLGAYVNVGAARVPKMAEAYGSTEQLLSEIRAFIYRYYDCDDNFLSVAALYALHTWVYEKFHALPYLRFIGLPGSGKSRGTEVIGAACYHPLVIAGAATSAPMFRMIEVFGGTLLMDEADFAKSQIGGDIVKILNCGYQQGLPVSRMEQNDEGKLEPKIYDVFGPKIINGRKAFQDDATESRCIQYTPKITTRTDLPFHLGKEFKKEASEIQNKALQWRFDHLNTVELDASFRLSGVRPRTNQILGPLVTICGLLNGGKSRYMGDLRSYAELMERRSMDERKESWEARILTEYERLRTSQANAPTCGEIAKAVQETWGVEDSTLVWLNAVKVGRIFREMGVHTKHVKRGSIIEIEEARRNSLYERFGIGGDGG